MRFAAIGASSETDQHKTAVKACTTANGHQPASLVTAIDDGRGGSLVWLTDAEANLWFCSTDAAGKIYAYITMTGDLLQGAGASLLPESRWSMTSSACRRPHPNPLDIAELAYEAYFSGDTGKVIDRALDGLGDKFVPGYYVLSRMMAAPIFAPPPVTHKCGPLPKSAIRSPSATLSAKQVCLKRAQGRKSLRPLRFPFGRSPLEDCPHFPHMRERSAFGGR